MRKTLICTSSHLTSLQLNGTEIAETALVRFLQNNDGYWVEIEMPLEREIDLTAHLKPKTNTISGWFGRDFSSVEAVVEGEVAVFKETLSVLFRIL